MNEPRLIALHSRDGGVRAYTLVDETDYVWASRYRWCLSGPGYVTRRGPDETRIYMHREILGLLPGDERQADHVNRVCTDNRRSNLRIVTRGQNSQNVRPRAGTSSQYRGVCWNGRSRKWMAYGIIDGKQKFLGHFDVEADAAECAHEWREKNLSHYSEEAVA